MPKKMRERRAVIVRPFGGAVSDPTNQRGNRSRGPTQPPPFSSTIAKRMIVRWTTTGAINNLVVTFVNIGDIYNVAMTATSAAQVWNSVVKVHRLSVWGAAPANGAISTATVDFEGVAVGAVGQSTRFSDTVTGTARGPIVHAYPSADCQAAQFQPANGNNNTCFQMTCPSQSIVELEYTGVNDENGGHQNVANAPVGATAGIFYCRGLDGIALATTQFATVSFFQD